MLPYDTQRCLWTLLCDLMIVDSARFESMLGKSTGATLPKSTLVPPGVCAEFPYGSQPQKFKHSTGLCSVDPLFVRYIIYLNIIVRGP